MDQAYTVGQWAGYALYQCNLCPFNSTEEHVAVDHAMTHQMQPAEESHPHSGLVLVADKNGNEIAVDASSVLAETDELSEEELLALLKRPTKRRRS